MPRRVRLIHLIEAARHPLPKLHRLRHVLDWGGEVDDAQQSRWNNHELPQSEEGRRVGSEVLGKETTMQPSEPAVAERRLTRIWDHNTRARPRKYLGES